jgi:hypothetical protein
MRTFRPSFVPVVFLIHVDAAGLGLGGFVLDAPCAVEHSFPCRRTPDGEAGRCGSHAREEGA